MKRFLLSLFVAFVIIACGSIPIIPSPAGGASSFGGAPSTGGVSASGGSTATSAASQGGEVASGGTSATTTDIKWLACNDASKAKPLAKHNLSGWHKSADRAKHKRLKASYKLVANSVFWSANIKTPLDQGNLGSCTGNATAQCLSTFPFPYKLAESDAVKIYSLATTLDQFKGTYPPTDTGSDGQSAARAAKQLGYTTLDFAAVDTVEGLQAALQRGPCIIGTNWYSSFSTPTRCGEMTLSGTNDGGHEIEVIGLDVKLKRVLVRNSWGPDWGNCREGDPDDCGYAYWSLGTVQTLIKRGAEIDCPVIE